MPISVFGSRASGLRLARMQASPSWVDGRFCNVHPIIPGLRDRSVASPGLPAFIRGSPRRKPPTGLPSIDPRDAWRRTPDSGLRATWLGHSTVLVEIDGCNVLTDPVWGPRASPFRFLGPERYQPVPVQFEQLPRLDAVIVSHDHYDHLDYPTIRLLAASDVPIVTSLGVGAHLEAWGIAASRIVELDWWETHRVPGTPIAITAAPSQHFSGRDPRHRNETLWSSMVIRGERHAVFFSGDTGLTTQYADILARLGPFDLVMLEIGAFHPSWGDIHLGPAHALEAHALLGGAPFLPVHWGTFSLGVHDWDEPIETLLTLASKRDASLLLPRLGEPTEPARGPLESPWWRAVDQRSAVVPPG